MSQVAWKRATALSTELRFEYVTRDSLIQPHLVLQGGHCRIAGILVEGIAQNLWAVQQAEHL